MSSFEDCWTKRKHAEPFFHKTSDCVMCVKTDVFLQFSSPSLAPVSGTNCPKTDAFSAYDGCIFGIFGIGSCIFGIV